MTWGALKITTFGVARAASGGLLATVLLAGVSLAQAPGPSQPSGGSISLGALPSGSPPSAAPPRGAESTEGPGLLESIGRWLDRQTENIGSTFKDAGKGVANFGHEAGVAAQSTVEGAKDAADAVARIPTARVITGHEKCRTAPNGAPDCVAAATAMCKARGYGSGKSADMTTAVVCPAQVYLSGRNSGPECRTETFVSRALCQ